MSNNKQSSLDYLISQLQKSKDWYRVLNEVSQMSSAKVDIIAEAKAMHKEEIMEAHGEEQSKLQNDGSWKRQTPEQYYNETFGGDK